MNKQRRKDIANAIDILSDLKEKFGEAKSIIENAAVEEREYYDNMPEGLQNGDRGSEADQKAQTLEEVQSSLDDFGLDDLIQQLEDAQS